MSTPPPPPMSIPPALQPSHSHSKHHTKRIHDVPFLLEAFPVPPSHIPPSPHVPPNPPPSLPPSAPLPPVPGPSPLSERDTLLFIASARSRRSSRISTSSRLSSHSAHSTSTRAPSPFDSLSRRSSTASNVQSIHSYSPATPSSAPPPFSRPRKGSLTSLRSVQSTTSLSAPRPSFSRNPSYTDLPSSSAGINYSISEEDPADLTRVEVDQISRSSPLPVSDLDDMDLPPSITRRRTSMLALDEHDLGAINPDDSITSIDMRDLPDDDDALPSARSSPSSSPHRKTPPFSPPSSFKPATPPLRQKQRTSLSSQNDNSFPRTTSPDIADFISATPRPRRPSTSSRLSRASTRVSRSSTYSTQSAARLSTSVSRLAQSASGTLPLRRHTGDDLPRPRRISDAADNGPASGLPYLQEDSLGSDFGVVDSTMRKQSLDTLGSTDSVFRPMSDRRLTDQFDDALEKKRNSAYDAEDGHNSDSSIDLHTPLPNLMLRHGLLSPNSKLLPPRSDSAGKRPDSVASVATNTSSMTKCGLMKDERDTPKRRVRHRDGKLLRGGIGLTTGLGWSDSEDEDAPSPLTRRLSSLNLSRRSSASSLQATPHPLSRSISSSILHEIDEFSVSPHSHSSKPVNPQAGPSIPSGTRIGHTPRAVSTPNPRMSATSATSSLALSIPDSSYSITPTQNVFPPTSDHGTLSSESSLSLPLPATPESTDDGPRVVGNDNGVKVGKERINVGMGIGMDKNMNIEKGLPPLPNGMNNGLRKYPSSMGLRAAFVAGAGAGVGGARPRTYSSASSVSSVGVAAGANAARSAVPQALRSSLNGTSGSAPSPGSASTSAHAKSGITSPRASQMLLPRPLKLAQAHPQARLQQPGEQAKPGQVLVYNRNVHDQQRSALSRGSTSTASSAAPSPTSPTSPADCNSPRPKPRTGTGMVYRNSSNPSGAGSRMRMPSSGVHSPSLGVSSPSLGIPSPSPSSLRTPSPAFGKMPMQRAVAL